MIHISWSVCWHYFVSLLYEEFIYKNPCSNENSGASNSYQGRRPTVGEKEQLAEVKLNSNVVEIENIVLALLM